MLTARICGGWDFEAPTYQTITILSKCIKDKLTRKSPAYLYLLCLPSMGIFNLSRGCKSLVDKCNGLNH